MAEKRTELNSGPAWAASAVAVVIAGLVTWAISDGGNSIGGDVGGDGGGGVKVAVICAIWAFLLNWLVCIPSFRAQTEKFFDLTGSITYLTVILLALVLSDDLDFRSVLLGVLVAIWAIRLGSFLFSRINRDGKDGRFDKLKLSFALFFRTWSLQGLWVSLTAAAAIAAITSGAKTPFGAVGVIGLIVWVFGFAVEAISDSQKNAFRSDSANEGRFITTGLWAWSRHPNYFGEIVLWLGIAIIALPAFQGWQWVALISPIFVFVLLTRISGVPLLERRSDKRWGDEAAYQEYKAKTPVLMLKPPRRR